MFGSKIRSWMENHIVRPRKKGNKSNKNGTSGNSALSTSNGNGLKTSSFQVAETNTTAGPARRSEVSPIQNHTTSRAGWQSPQQENAMSPKSDHFLYRHTIKSPPTSANASPRNMPRKSSYTLDHTSGAHHSQHQRHGHPTSHPPHSNYQPVSLPYSTGETQFGPTTNDPPAVNSGIRYSTTASSSSTSNEMLLDSNHPQYERIIFDGPSSAHHYYSPPSHPHNSRDSGHETNNRDSFGSSSTASSSNYRPHSDVWLRDTGNDGSGVDSKSDPRRNQPTKHQYGKIMLRNQEQSISGSRLVDSRIQMPDGAAQPIQHPANAAQKAIHPGNGHLRNGHYPPVACDNRRSLSMSPTATNNNHLLPVSGGLAADSQRHRPNPHVSYVNGNGANTVHHQGLTHGGVRPAERGGRGPNDAIIKTTAASVHSPSRHRTETARSNNNMLRPISRAGGGGCVNGGGHPLTTLGGAGPPHHLVHMINSLSSPESAYSTGYSTDGTSPGTGTAPEYYINMRTGTHYFPRGANGVVEQNRHKFGLNKIEEAAHYDLTNANNRRLESMSCEMARRHLPYAIGATSLVMAESSLTQNNNGHLIMSKQMLAATANGMSPDVQRRLTMQAYKTMESPSPRQRCRIRTNPWFSSIDPTLMLNANKMKAIDMDISSTSSGIKSSSDTGKKDQSGKNIISSGSEDSSSDTEIEVNNKKNTTPGTIRKRKVHLEAAVSANNNHVDSDEDATLNEMMGKFDESYCYEKETDILSDSDPTECISDLDTGQEAGDECDTDDLLEIDFIDTGSIQEVIDNNIYENTGNCSYHQNHGQHLEKPASRRSGSRKPQVEESIGSRRRKRLTRTRKSSRECRDGSAGQWIAPANVLRPSRSLGGTPVSLRRNKAKQSKSPSQFTPLENRANSMTFTETHSIRNGVLTVAESEKALIKADLEADVKYKQLIHEAETILVSMKTSTSTSTSVRETPVASPRRVCPIPTNKRVEMLRQCEADLRREINKAQRLSEIIDGESMSPSTHSNVSYAPTLTQENLNIVINKRVEVLKFETTTTSTPNSPKSARFSPRKTHVTNFIYQNTSPTDLMRRKSSSDTTSQPETADVRSSKYSPQLQLNGRRLPSPPKSPMPVRRRFRSQSPRVSIDSESDTPSDDDGLKAKRKLGRRCSNDGQENAAVKKVVNRGKPKFGDEGQFVNGVERNAPSKKKSLLSFRSIDMGNRVPENSYCPQSEPLKRKVYSGSQTLERLQKTLEQESEIPKKALLEKISQLRRERKAAAAKTQTDSTTFEPMNYMVGSDADSPLMRRAASPMGNERRTEQDAQGMKRQQLILSTLADLKRSLEDQSIELCGLNDDADE